MVFGPGAGHGIGGYSTGDAYIELQFDCENFDFGNILHAIIGGFLAHELHHRSRCHSIRMGNSLGEWLVSEGLAQVFSEEAGYPPAFFSHTCASAPLAAFARR